MKKIILIILIVLMIIIGAIALSNVSKANFTIDNAELHSTGTYSNYLHWGDISLVTEFVVYSKDGVDYPAYCLNRDLKGVDQNLSYSVSVNDLLTNVQVWRAIVNGYPYKTPEELGCATKEEAFFATKQAVYCMIYNRDLSEYSAPESAGETGKRTLNALKQIVTNARNSNEVKVSPNLTIKEVTTKWEQDNIDNKYVSKVFTISANSTINSYTAKLEGMNVEGAKLVDEKNNEKTEFKFGENFKIIIPITNMKEEGSFNIKVDGKVATKPVLYGYSADRSKQDYAIAGNVYEEGSGTRVVYYTKNETKIIVLKENEEGEKLEGVKFRLLDENKEVIYSDLTTNKDGKITIENLAPGLYYLEEVETVDGYSVYDQLIDVKISYNEAFTITVTNTKQTIEIEKPEIKENEKGVKAEEVVVKLPKTGM